MYLETFDYIDWDEKSQAHCDRCRDLAMALEAAILDIGPSRSRSLALTKLEETFMWVGKAIRSEQWARHEAVIRAEADSSTASTQSSV
jgi:hypothetical protein